MTEPASQPSEGMRIARNSAFLAAGQLVTLVLGFGSTLLVTDLLGQDHYGVLVGVQRFVAICLLVVQFGLDPLLVRSIAQGVAPAGVLLATTLAIRLVLSFAFAGTVVLSANVLDYLPGYHWALYAFAAIELVGALGETVLGAFEGKEDMGRSALITSIRSVVSFIGFVTVYLMDAGLAGVLVVFAAARLVQTVASFGMFRRALPGMHLSVDLSRVKPLLSEAMPFVVIGLSFLLRRNLDVVFLTELSSIQQVSFYGAAFNFLQVIFALPLLVQRVLLPVFSRLHEEGDAAGLSRDLMTVLSAVLLPTGVGLALLADSAVSLYPSGEYAEAAPVLQALALILLVHAPSMVMASLLTGAGRTWTVVGCYGVSIPIQTALYLWWIPGSGAVGAALATAAAGGFHALLLAATARPLGLRVPWLALLRHLGAAGAMGAAILPLVGLFPLIPMLAGGAAYLGSLWVLSSEASPERRALRALWARSPWG